MDHTASLVRPCNFPGTPGPVLFHAEQQRGHNLLESPSWSWTCSGEGPSRISSALPASPGDALAQLICKGAKVPEENSATSEAIQLIRTVIACMLSTLADH